MSPLVQSVSSLQAFSALEGCVQTFGYDRSVGRQSSPCVVSHFESSEQKRGHCVAASQMLPASPSEQQSSPWLVSHWESSVHDFAQVGAQMPSLLVPEPPVPPLPLVAPFSPALPPSSPTPASPPLAVLPPVALPPVAPPPVELPAVEPPEAPEPPEPLAPPVPPLPPDPVSFCPAWPAELSLLSFLLEHPAKAPSPNAKHEINPIAFKELKVVMQASPPTRNH
jgi:hypothetical protein